MEKGCAPGEVLNIRSSLASVYKINVHIIGHWKVSEDNKTEGTSVHSLIVLVSMRIDKRQKNVLGFKRALPFLFAYMANIWT